MAAIDLETYLGLDSRPEGFEFDHTKRGKGSIDWPQRMRKIYPYKTAKRKL